MTVAELDDVQYDLEVDGQEVRRQLSRRVWERAGWATIVISFSERDPKQSSEAWKPARLAILRFRRMNGAWQRQAQITLPGDEAADLARTILDWLGPS